MKLTMIVLTTTAVTTTPLWASNGPEPLGTSLLVLFFLGFGALIVVCQLIPGLALFCAMMRGLFSKDAIKHMPLPNHTEKTV